MDKIDVVINGKTVSCLPGQTILQVVREHKLDDIPTLCHDDRLPSYSSCFMCVVAVKGLNKLVPSCTTPVAPGMEITTNNAEIMSARKTALELLLSNHYADCIAPCRKTCPAGVDVQGYIAYMSMGKHREAIRLIKETNPLPLVCGRVCVRECEAACRRNRVDEPVAIDYLKRYASDLDIQEPWTPECAKPNGKRVAIVGGGPAGLTCAYYLILKGYAVTLYEASPALGGMLRYGIPEYRLPKGELDKEIGWITGLGVEVKLEQQLGRDFTLASLKEKGFDAIYLALGAQGANRMRVPEEDTTPGVVSGVAFLRDVQLKGEQRLSGTVVVVGGGNTAIDSARTALRLGAEQVIILYRRTRKEMPAWSIEVDAAIEEGVDIRYLAAPTKIVKKDGRLAGLECIQMKLGEPDASGRRRPLPVTGSEHVIACDTAISAIGQVVRAADVKQEKELELTRWGTIVADESTLATSMPGVFAGGDVVTGPKVAIEAIAQGKQAALSIDRYIASGKVRTPASEFYSCKDAFGELPDSEFEAFPRQKREKMPELRANERINTFAEVELGYSSAQVEKETRRCLECGCQALYDCKLKRYADAFQIDMTPYLGEVRQFKTDSSHPFIHLDPNKCINCGRCVRTCGEILEVSALSFVNRGFQTIVRPAMGKRLLETNCISCGNCIAACPTGAILEKLPFKKPGPFKAESHEAVCSLCSVGCRMEIKKVNNAIFWPDNAEDGGMNNGYLCVKGKFGSRYLLSEERLLQPQVTVEGRKQRLDWQDTIAYTAKKLKYYQKHYGTDSVAVCAGPNLTNEAAYLLSKFARCTLGNNNIFSVSRLFAPTAQDELDAIMGYTRSSTDLDSLEQADIILLVNPGLNSENMILHMKIKEARKKGAFVILLQSAETELTRCVDMWLDTTKGTNTLVLNGMMHALIQNNQVDKAYIKEHTTGFSAFSEAISSDDENNVLAASSLNPEKWRAFCRRMADKDARIIAITNLDATTEKSHNDVAALAHFMILTGRMDKQANGLILVRNAANAQGILDMGCAPGYLPGGVTRTDSDGIARIQSVWKRPLADLLQPVAIKEALLDGSVKACLIFGEDPLCRPELSRFFSQLDFLVVSDYFMTQTAQAADVILPAATCLETNGSYTACDNRVQAWQAIQSPACGMTTLQAIAALAQAMGANAADFHTINQEICRLVSGFAQGKMSQKPHRPLSFQVFARDLSSLPPQYDSLLSVDHFFRDKVKRNLQYG